MIQVSGLFKTYGDQVLFENGGFSLGQGERVGLVGRNGSGKSTLLKMILDEEHPDEGTVTFPKGYRIGKLSQHLKFTEPTILQEAALGLPQSERDEIYKAEIILSGLGFSEADMERAPSEFSGGFQIRINLARLLLSEPNLLLLDEPTNYLDIVSARWLAETLRSWKGEIILVTHDRSFMDSVTTHTMLIYRGGFRKIAGHTEKLYDAIKLDEEVYEKTRLNDDRKRREMEQFINRFRAKASKATLVQSRIKALEKMTVREELVEDDTLDFVFASIPFYGKTLMDMKDISFGYGSGPELIRDLSISIGKSDRIGIIGKNGRGKSTLLKIMAGELKSGKGSLSMSPGTSLQYFGQTNVSKLRERMTVEEEIADAHPGMHRTRVRGICGTMMFDGDKALKKISVLSGGERSRVLLGRIIATPSNLLLLDEPTNHLDLESVEALKDALVEYEGALALVTHDEMLLREICTRLIIFQGDKPFVLEGGYDYFLEKIGWEDEGGVVQKPTASKSKAADSGKAKAKKERTLEKTIERTEAKIVGLEKEEKDLKNKLAEASKLGRGADIQTFSLKAHEVSLEIEKAFEELSNASKELEVLRRADS